MDSAVAGEPVRGQTTFIVSAMLLFGFVGCTEDAPSGYAEPMRAFRSVDGTRVLGEFFKGSIPVASSATDAGSATTAEQLPLRVTQFEPPNRVILPGFKGSKVKGRLSQNASAVALSFDTGSGYWVLPAGTPDSSSDDELTWLALCDYSPDIAPGYHEITAAAVDESGTYGAPLTKKLCIKGRTPDGLNACESTLAPPMTVIGLSWDTNVDLDLQVVPPSADRIVSPKHPTTVDRNTDGTLPDEAGVIDRDSNAACAIDGIRYENLVFEKVKPTGVWGIYVNLFDSCKQAAVRFAVGVYVRKSDGTDENGKALYHLEQVGEARHGMLLNTQANGESGTLGTYLFEVKF